MLIKFLDIWQLWLYWAFMASLLAFLGYSALYNPALAGKMYLGLMGMAEGVASSVNKMKQFAEVLFTQFGNMR